MDIIYKNCPHCGEKIEIIEEYCPHCGKFIPQEENTSPFLEIQKGISKEQIIYLGITILFGIIGLIMIISYILKDFSTITDFESINDIDWPVSQDSVEAQYSKYQKNEIFFKNEISYTASFQGVDATHTFHFKDGKLFAAIIIFNDISKEIVNKFNKYFYDSCIFNKNLRETKLGIKKKFRYKNLARCITNQKTSFELLEIDIDKYMLFIYRFEE